MQRRNPILKTRGKAVTAMMLVAAFLLCTCIPEGLPEIIGQHLNAPGHGSGEAPFLPQRVRPRILSSQFALRTNSAAAKDTVIFAFGSTAGAIDDVIALRSLPNGDLVHLLFLLRNTSPDRAPPQLI